MTSHVTCDKIGLMQEDGSVPKFNGIVVSEDVLTLLDKYAIRGERRLGGVGVVVTKWLPPNTILLMDGWRWVGAIVNVEGNGKEK